MADQSPAEAHLSELQILVKSRILERLQRELESDERAAATMYTKSDGKNYGMYQKADQALAEIYDQIFGGGGVNKAAFMDPPSTSGS